MLWSWRPLLEPCPLGTRGTGVQLSRSVGRDPSVQSSHDLSFKSAHLSFNKLSGGPVGTGVAGCWYLQLVGDAVGRSPGLRLSIARAEGAECDLVIWVTTALSSRLKGFGNFYCFEERGKGEIGCTQASQAMSTTLRTLKTICSRLMR